ncbi:Nif3-like dinuclear metal center hexameric protein [Mycoplasmopsis primatum]|uniref:Nif3-like dinuclear metal center hexameric protein n=1 Tax=Mycoplasmopsis primatum TaxID=55604 RepID=UPI0004961F92|nr:Nif3-like dinuclear metal center hexameric protein [Mycoplasmopsis primatum]
MQIKTVINYLLNKYPLENKEEWDPSGWSLKFNLSDEITGIVFAIDLTKQVLERALETYSNLIITHHPFKFQETWEEEFIQAPYKKEILEQLKANRINVISFHTNYDNHKEGTSYQIVKKLGLAKSAVHFDWSNYPVGFSWNKTYGDLLVKLAITFGFRSMRNNLSSFFRQFNYSEKVAVLAGSGFVGDVNRLYSEGYKLIITSDVKWNEWLNYNEINVAVLEIPHLVEEVFAEDVFNQIKEKFPDVPIFIVKMKIQEIYENISF